jgi:histidinol-phosphate/aromatic aminotransferase/cobyric acid decarboxylase-like protein/choline kinase
MQAIILAAGMGNRLGKWTRNNTKCMLAINGKTLIERALDALDAAGIQECVIVAGYQKENLTAFVGKQYKNINITYVANDVYNKTNNIYSLYLAKEYLSRDDTILLESDLIFEDSIVKELLAHPEPSLAVVAPWEPWMDGTVVQITADNVITDFISKKYFKFDEKSSYYKTVNIYKFSKEFSANSYIPFLEAYTKVMGRNEYYEQVLRVITTLDRSELKAFVLKNHQWYEIDDAQDKDIAEVLFANSAAEKLTLMSRRYGGYWRFPRMLDFCYLVNPYFPTGQLRHEIKSYFPELLTEYPSGLNTQNLLSAKLFNVDEAYILTGNGAAELIRAMLRLLKGSVGIIYPTFNEYGESLAEGASIVKFYPKNAPEDFSYTAEDLIAWSERCDTLILINPDNPSGAYTKKIDVLRLLAVMQKNNKKLILDESFIDFSDAEDDRSLLCEDILEKYPALIIIKSLSKSYGIPGIRLGILASGDKTMLANIRKNISIWNINSFAEYFLQIIGKYAKDYEAACKSIACERSRFKEALAATKLFTVYPSQSNYFLCRCKSCSAKRLAEQLLEKHNIFIKDLTGKNGIPDESFVRLAIRNKADNDRLIEALGSLRLRRFLPSPSV